MGKCRFYFPVTWTLEHAAFQLLQQLNPKSSFTSHFSQVFRLSCKIPSERWYNHSLLNHMLLLTAGLQITDMWDLTCKELQYDC